MKYGQRSVGEVSMFDFRRESIRQTGESEAWMRSRSDYSSTDIVVLVCVRIYTQSDETIIAPTSTYLPRKD